MTSKDFRAKPKYEVVLRTPAGRYLWWPPLQQVDYVLNGARFWNVTDSRNTARPHNRDSAILAACRMEQDRIKAARKAAPGNAS